MSKRFGKEEEEGMRWKRVVHLSTDWTDLKGETVGKKTSEKEEQGKVKGRERKERGEMRGKNGEGKE